MGRVIYRQEATLTANLLYNPPHLALLTRLHYLRFWYVIG